MAHSETTTSDSPALQAHSWRFYLSPREAWDAMYDDCEQATKSIELEQYILENDAIGRKFMRLFIQKAAQGIRVFVIFDKFGSQTLVGSRLVRLLRRGGGRFRFYNWVTYLDLLRPWRWYPRKHVKALLIDSQIAYTGGVCFALRMRDWRDTHIRITGPVVAQFRQAFDQAQRRRGITKRPTLPKDGNGEFTYLQNYPRFSWFAIYDELIRAITRAEHYIYLTTPFFAPNRRFRRLLANAALRGVDVRILVPKQSEFTFVDWICLSYSHGLLRAGVRIFRYRPFMLHSKTVVSDDHWGTVGSTNMDILSFFRNRESNIVTTNVAAVAELKQQFMADLEESDELTLEAMSRQPMWKRAAGYLARLLRSFA